MLSYDDVASSVLNPIRGTLFNKPASANGVNVYEGCNIDYRGNQVTPQTLMAVMKGDAKTAGGKVLKSNQNSKVFFYFADHGAPGLLAMPAGGYLYADKFHETLKFMYANQMYDQMVLYIEACESGSMFENILESNLNIYAVSAANSSESSWGTYCYPNDIVNGKHIGSCLGDLFSVNWMEDAEKAKMNMETLQDQYDTVKKLTAKSHVLQWGQLDFTTEPIGVFESAKPLEDATMWQFFKNEGKKFLKDVAQIDADSIAAKNNFGVDSRDNMLHYRYAQVMENPSFENHQALQNELEHRMQVDNFFKLVFPHHMKAVENKTTPLPTQFDCYRRLISTYQEVCESIDDYTLKYMKVFVAECEGLRSVPSAIDSTIHRMKKACSVDSLDQ
jgi:legumain